MSVIPPAKAVPAPSSNEPIKAFDKYGREILVPRQDWIDQVIQPNLDRVWNQPDELAGFLIHAIRDGFFAEVEEGAKQLHRIDSQPSRGAALLAIVYLQTARPEEAERVLSMHLEQHGEDGVVLTNLAKSQAAQGREDESLQTLWRALELEPNQDIGLGWYDVIHREKGGPEAGQEALRRIAALPGSWRAQLWLARSALESRDLDSAVELYRHSLEMAGKPVPTDLLTQMSGDLGNHGHLPMLLELTAPHFDESFHGLMVGNNLIKASLDTGQFDAARILLRRLESCQRPDWRETLGFWESELTKANLETREPFETSRLQIAMLSIDGPLWLKKDHPLGRRFKTPAADAPHVVFLGSSYETAVMPSASIAHPSDNPGRMSRALPLYLSETIFLGSDARTTTLVPWITNGGGGFGVFGKPVDLSDMAEQIRQMYSAEGDFLAADFLVATHLVICGENWRVQLNLVRTIDGKTVASRSYDFAEADFEHIASRVTGDLFNALVEEAGIERRRDTHADSRLERTELDHYLFRMEQVLAVRCSTANGSSPDVLSNPAEIFDGLLHLCLRNPTHIPSRCLLWSGLSGLADAESELVKSMSAKVRGLQAEHPLSGEIHHLLDSGFRRIFEE